MNGMYKFMPWHEMRTIRRAPCAIVASSAGRYVDDAGDLDAPEGVSYAEWEREQAVNVQIPACTHV